MVAAWTKIGDSMSERAPFLERPFLERLRTATRPAHAAIEHVPALARLMAPDITLADVGAALRGLHAFHAGLDPRLAACLVDVPGAAAYHDTTRLPALAEDLAFHGLAPGPAAPPYALPALPSLGHALGCLYVIEGSSLGGRVIARRLQDALGLMASQGATFFAGRSAAEVRTRFQNLASLLDHEAGFSPAAAAAILAGANDTFHQMARWMTDPDRAGAADLAA